MIHLTKKGIDLTFIIKSVRKEMGIRIIDYCRVSLYGLPSTLHKEVYSTFASLYAK
jgi:hypothetical protein